VKKRWLIIAGTILLVFSTTWACSKNSNDNEHTIKDPVTRAYNSWLAVGEEAIPDIKKAAGSENWRMRSHAMLALGKLGDQRHVSIVLDRLKNDTRVPVRNSAVIALGNLEAEKAVPVLVPLLQKKSGVSQSLVAEALGRIGDPVAVKPLYRAMYMKNRALRLKVVNALLAIDDPLASRLIMKDMKKIRSSDLERYAARIFGKMPVPGSESFCIELAESGSIPEKTSAIVALGQMRSKPAVPVLVMNIRSEHELLRERAAESLIKVDASSSVAPLTGLISSKVEEVAMVSARVLSRLSAPGIGKRVYAVFRATPSANKPAAYVLGRKRYMKAVPLLQSRLEKKSQDGRNEMARALGWMEHEPSASLLMKVAESRDSNGAYGAVWALGQMKVKRSVPLLITLLDADEKKLVAESIAALGSIGDPRAVEPMIRLYYGTGDTYAPYVGTALAKMGGERVREFVKVNIESGDRSRQRMAGQMLVRMKDPEFQRFAIGLLDHSDRLVRGYAVEYLTRVTGKNFKTLSGWKEWAKSRGE